MMERLRATYDARANHYDSAGEFLGDLNLIADSLRDNKGEHAGLFQVRRLIRRVRTFGFHLATLDIRQNAGAHRTVIAQGLGDPQWCSRSSEERAARLREALERDEAADLRARSERQAQPVGVRSADALPAPLWHRRDRAVRRQRRARRRRHAFGAAAVALGGYDGQPLGRRADRRCAAVRIRRGAACVRRHHDAGLQRARVSQAPGRPRQPSVRHDRLLGEQQGERHRHVALAAAQSAGGVVRRGRSAPAST